MTRRAPRFLIPAVCAALAATAHAVDRTATLAANGTWSTLPWFPAGAPAKGDNATLTSTSSPTVTIDTNNTAPTRLGNILANSSAGTLSLSQSPTGPALFATNFTLATTGKAAYAQSAGTLDLSNALNLGQSANATGYYSLSGTALLNAFVLQAGVTGVGSVSQTGGTALSSGLTLGAAANSTGYYSLSAGTLTTGNEFLGVTGSGTMTQTGGTHTATLLDLAHNPGSSALFSLSNAATLTAATIVVRPNATFTQTGGSLSFNNFSQTGGAVSLPTLSLPTNSNNYALAAGTLTLDYLDTAATPARLNWTGGTLAFTQTLRIGSSATTAFGATFNALNTPAKTLTTPNLFLGDGDTATGSQSAGTNAVTTYFVLATTPASTASYTLTGGLLSAAEADIGSGGAGSFTHAGGTVSLTYLLLANTPAAAATYSLAGTASLHTSSIQVVGYAGPATFTQTGGYNASDGALTIGANATANGTYLLSGTASLTDTVAHVGLDGAGSFVQTGGSHTVASSLNIANQSGSNGSYSISAGSLAAPTIFLGGSQDGPGGTGLLAISGAASVSVSGFLTLYDNPNDRLLLTGGSVTTPSLNLSGHPERFSWTGGTLTLTNGYTVDASLFPAATASLASGMTLASNAPSTNNGTITLRSGSLLAGTSNLTNNGLISGAGSIAKPLLNNATLLAGPGTLSVSSLTNPSTGIILIPPASTLSLPPGLATSAGTITLAGGTLDNTNHPLTNTGTIQGHGSLANTPTLTNNGSISITGGPLTFTGSLTGTGSLYIDPASSLNAPAGIAQSLLTTHGSVALSSPSSLTTLSFPSTDGSLDLTTTSLTTSTTPATLRQYLLSHQLFSSTAAADSQHRLALGYLTTAGITLIKTTYYGDANLDGKLTPDDYALLDRGYAKHLATWQGGDFNYDGQVTSADYLLIDRTLLIQAQGLETLGLLAQRESQFGTAYVTQLLASVPEPTSVLAACGFASLLLPLRRPRTSR